jgi:hypothetical protein
MDKASKTTCWLAGKHLTAEKFQEVVSELERQQNQTTMFDMEALELQVERQVDKLLADPSAGQTFISLTLNNCAIVYVMVQHKPGQQVVIDQRYIAQAIQISGG